MADTDLTLKIASASIAKAMKNVITEYANAKMDLNEISSLELAQRLD